MKNLTNLCCNRKVTQRNEWKLFKLELIRISLYMSTFATLSSWLLNNWRRWSNTSNWIYGTRFAQKIYRTSVPELMFYTTLLKNLYAMRSLLVDLGKMTTSFTKMKYGQNEVMQYHAITFLSKCLRRVQAT